MLYEGVNLPNSNAGAKIGKLKTITLNKKQATAKSQKNNERVASAIPTISGKVRWPSTSVEKSQRFLASSTMLDASRGTTVEES